MRPDEFTAAYNFGQYKLKTDLAVAYTVTNINSKSINYKPSSRNWARKVQHQ
jgi:hypothetical protein